MLSLLKHVPSSLVGVNPSSEEDYDFELLYQPGKANVVADALSRKKMHVS